MWDGTFHHIRIQGRAGALLWSYHTAATLGPWAIRKGGDGRWILTGTCTRVDAFQIRQRPILFTGPREHGDGMWCWGVESLDVVGHQVRARLGPPEQ